MAERVSWEKLALFRLLSAEQRSQLVARCRRRSYKKGDVLFYQEEEGGMLYILLSGKVGIANEGADREMQLLHIHQAGECVGELSLIDGLPRSARAFALEAVEALTLARLEFLALLEQKPQVALAVMAALAGMVRRLTDQVEDFTTLNVPARLAKKLLQFAAQYGSPADDGIHVSLPLSQEGLARMIGTTRQTINKELRKLERAGAVGTAKGEIILRDRSKLETAIEIGTRGMGDQDAWE